MTCCNGHKVVITDTIRGTVDKVKINCWLIDPDDGRCSPVDPWYNVFASKYLGMGIWGGCGAFVCVSGVGGIGYPSASQT